MFFIFSPWAPDHLPALFYCFLFLGESLDFGSRIKNPRSDPLAVQSAGADATPKCRGGPDFQGFGA